jgi:hypothetical protein
MQLGDIIEFENVPYTCLGLPIKGFADNTNFTSTINGQTIYASFIITSITKQFDKIRIEAVQTHDLNGLSISYNGAKIMKPKPKLLGSL